MAEHPVHLFQCDQDHDEDSPDDLAGNVEELIDMVSAITLTELPFALQVVDGEVSDVFQHADPDVSGRPGHRTSMYERVPVQHPPPHSAGVFVGMTIFRLCHILVLCSEVGEGVADQ